MNFNTILIANRGEIACRIIRTIREMGLRSVAVYSEADRDAPHVRLADDAVLIGPAPVNESYLVIDNIIEAAKTSGAQAVHPGYGFLSENADFARACAKAGLTFIGPSPKAIALIGDKAAAKRHMLEAGVPCIPGYQGEVQDDTTLLKEAETIGFPLMVKAVTGGGGRGMRLVENSDDLPNAISAARSEALTAFGSDTLILERAIFKPRHVEIQVFGDSHGNIIHLGERDCSVQRRHQKVLEESPCPIMTDDLRDRMGEAAVKAAQSVDYVGAGTVEFLLDADNQFYFLEMNTRLQVEHPVTELVTGLDLVALQIHIAQGEPLGLSQDDIGLCGHAIEARLYAEDPTQDFLPVTGDILHLSFPKREGVRIDSGVETGGTVSPFYDPMLAKLIAFGPDRDMARRRLIRALEETVCFGVTTNRAFLIVALRKDEFVGGRATTAFISEAFGNGGLETPALSPQQAAIAAITQFIANRDAHSSGLPEQLLGWFSATPLATPYIYDDQRVKVTARGASHFKVQITTETYTIEILDRLEDRLQMDCNGRRQTVRFHAPNGTELHISFGDAEFHLINVAATRKSGPETAGEGDIRAPMHGVLADIFVSVGDTVKAGERLAVLEAMKMRHDILADCDGTVKDIHAAEGAQIAAHAPIITLDD